VKGYLLLAKIKSIPRIYVQALAAWIVCLGSFAEVNAQLQDSTNLISRIRPEQLESKVKSRFVADSVKAVIWAEQLKKDISGKHTLDSSRLAGKIDSLRNLSLPVEKYQLKLDSLNQKRIALTQEVEAKRDEVLAKTKGRLEKWKSDAQSRISQVQGKIPNSGQIPGNVSGNLPGDLPNALPSANIPSFDQNLPSVPGVGAGLDVMPDLNLPEMPELSSSELSNVNLSPDLSSINSKIDFKGLDKLGGLQDKLGGASEQINALRQVSTNPDQAIETTVKNVDKVGAFGEQLDGVEAVKDNEFMKTAEKLKDPNAMKEEAANMVMEKAVDHFAGKQEVLQKAMDQLSKLKNKYESLNSLSEVKTLPKNSMKGKPFRERFIPGVALQFLRGEDIFLDVNPYAGYRITGRFNAGMGWNQRIGYSLSNDYFTSASVIYGPRFYTELKTWKGFIARAEFEFMNTLVPPTITPARTDTPHREWVRTAFIGFKRDYRFLKHVKGTAFVMFSVYNDHRKSPYGDVVNSRFGFEFPLKSKPKQ
jgi:hypothetical protein